MNEEITILPIDPTTFELQNYNDSDIELIAKSELDTVFLSSTDYIEYYVYDENQTLLYPQGTTVPLTSFNVKQGDVLLNPQSDLENLGFDIGKYSITYDFYRKRLGSDINENYYIKEISSDRTEIRLDSNIISNSLIVSSSNEFIKYREDQPYFVDFYLNFGESNLIIANNINLDIENSGDPTILIKLYEPLPENLGLKDQLWVVELLSTPQAYQVDFPFIPTIEDDFISIAGPNFSLNINQELGNSSQTFSYNTLIPSDITSSVNQIKSLLNEKEININVDYEDFNEFIYFSTALTRLENFYYKVGLIENHTNELNIITSNITSGTTDSTTYSSSLAVLNSQIDTIIQNFDGYEYFMYFNSGSLYSYPKTNTTPPFALASTGSTEVLTWLGSADTNSIYFGGIALSASLYDEENQNQLYNTIPEYLREDSDNAKYELFIDMVSQHYDNIWLYTKDITNKFNADNRLDYGISKDLIADALKDFGVKLYLNNFNNTDLYSAFLGITPSGDTFPFPEMTGSLPTPSGYEYVDTQISSSDTIVPLNDINKRIYKRIYHNLPYLLKTKGTITGLRALITSYGIPDTILRISEFGGKDRNEAQDWDLKQNVFNYAFNTGTDSKGYISSSITPDSEWGTDRIGCIQFRFKSHPIPQPIGNDKNPNIRTFQTLISDDDEFGGKMVLEYNGGGFTTVQHSGSIPDPYDSWGTLKFIPNTNNPSISSSIYLPFFNEDWWSVQLNINKEQIQLFSANEIDGTLGFNLKSTIGGDFEDVLNSPHSSKILLNTPTGYIIENENYKPFSGSFQELRLWNQEISQSQFHDFTLNPYSVEGNGIGTTPDQLFFRAALGTQLDTGSRTSIHPRVTGSLSQITQSFSGGSSFFVSDEEWVTNKENIYQDQVPSGIKNRITDKISLEALNIAETPFGYTLGDRFATPSSIDSLSPFQSIQQESFSSSSYTPDINYLEVAFSPTNQINDDINAQLGYFNLGDYIGDPRHISSSDRSYHNLNILRDAYFEKYIKSYDVIDFVRLIKFFDNSLFKMIKDFTPARTSLASGVVVKQHLLERNKQRPAQISSKDVTYSGSIKPQSRNYNTGSGDVGQYESKGGSSIYKFTGGTGGSLERYNGLQSHPDFLNNRFYLTQSYSESIEGSIANTINNSGSFIGYKEILTSDQEEFYNGEFSGSNIIVTDLIANPGCGPYLKVTDKPIFFNSIVFSLTPGATNLQGTTTEDEILLNLNNPNPGDAWIVSKQTQISPPLSKVQYVKLSNLDINGVNIKNYLEDSPSIKWITSDASVVGGGGVVEYVIDGVTTFADSTLLRISQTQGDNIEQFVDNNNYFPITSSIDAGSENWTLLVRGNYTSSASLSNQNDNLQQGNFLNNASNYQKQYFWFWNEEVLDPQDFFNPGSVSTPTSIITSDISKFAFGSYNPKRTSNISWFFSASIAYSASDLGTGNVIISEDNIYHSASKYSGVDLYNQDFTIQTSISTPIYGGSFKPSPFLIDVQDSIFKETYNNFIPGDSGSAPGLIGGHPKIKIAGTASIDFHFPSLTIGGTPRTLAPNTPKFIPFSGSTLNTNNIDFDSPTFPFPQVLGISGSGLTEDGALQINYDQLSAYLGVRYHGDPQPGLVLGNFDINYDLYISANTTNYTASIQTKFYNNIGGEDWGDSNNNSQIFPSSNGVINISNATFRGGKRINTSGANIDYMGFRIVAKSPEPDFEYFIGAYNGILLCSYTLDNQSYSNARYPETSGEAWASTTFHGTSSNLQEFTSSFISSGEAYPTISLQTILKRTGSGIPPEGYIITSSDQITSEIYGGQTFIFPDSPITGILESNSTLTSSTINQEDDMYFIEYSMSNYNTQEDSLNENFDVKFLETGDINTKIILTQTAESEGGFQMAGSILIDRGNTDSPNSMGNTIISQPFVVPTSSSVGTASLTGSFSYPFNHDDVFRMAVEVDKGFGSGLTITEYTMSIFPSSSVYSPITPPFTFNNYKDPSGNGFIIPSYYGEDILPFNLALDCQPLLNNYNNTRENPYLMDISFNNVSGSIQPTNFSQILSNTANRSTTPESNYTSIRSSRPRYTGTKTTGNEYNVWSIQDVDTFGKTPVIELKDAYFGYFSNMKDLYPLVNDKISLELTYLLDQQSNAIPPSLEGFGINILEKTFPLNNPISIGFISASQTAQELDDSYPIFKTTSKPTPILYTQTSSAGYSTEIPLTGSGRISMYDNDDELTFVDYTFTAQGTSSFKDDNSTPSPFGTYTQIINPTEGISLNPYGASNYINPYLNGVLSFTDDSGRKVDTNPQRISMQTSFATSFLYESGRPELEFQIQMLVNDIPSNFNLEDISLKVYRTGQDPIDAGSIIGSGVKNLLRFVSDTTNIGGNFFRRSKTFSKTSNVGVYNKQKDSYFVIIENNPLEEFLSQKGLYTKGKGGSKDKGDITGLEFIIKADSGEHIFEDGDNAKFKLTIDLDRAGRNQNVLFPDDYTGPIFPSKISTIGERTALLAGDNKGIAPFWVYTGSAGGGSNILDKSILVMSSSNINEAYGGTFYQGPLVYQPGSTEYFDSGVEPAETQFPKITSPIEFLPGDEIRFGNNENYSYTIVSITNPESNIEGDGKGRIKIQLDSEVPQSINKDFFLIRRYTPKASSFIINTPFPYSAESSGSSASGIIYPTFPTEYIKNSGSLIITELISKGVIT